MTHLLPALVLATVMVAGDAPTHRVHLGIDCNPGVEGSTDEVAYAVSLPDDVLTECEGEGR